MSFRNKPVFGKLFKKDSGPKCVEDLVFLESSDVDKIRRKLARASYLGFTFRWRYHPQEDICVIHYAAARGSTRAISCLVESGVDVNTLTSAQGLTPLHFAVLFSNLTIIEELVNRGGDINAREYARGYTPLHYACERKNLGAVKCLLGLLADQDVLDVYGRSPLDMARAMKSDQICKILSGHKDSDTMKANVNFLASEQRRQTERFDTFADDVQKKFQEIDYWRTMVERRVSETEKYQRLRQSLREAKNRNPLFYQDPSGSLTSSVSDLSVTSELNSRSSHMLQAQVKRSSVSDLSVTSEVNSRPSHMSQARNKRSSVSDLSVTSEASPRSNHMSQAQIKRSSVSDLSVTSEASPRSNHMSQDQVKPAYVSDLSFGSKINSRLSVQSQGQVAGSDFENHEDCLLPPDCTGQENLSIKEPIIPCSSPTTPITPCPSPSDPTIPPPIPTDPITPKPSPATSLSDMSVFEEPVHKPRIMGNSVMSGSVNNLYGTPRATKQFSHLRLPIKTRPAAPTRQLMAEFGELRPVVAKSQSVRNLVSKFENLQTKEMGANKRLLRSSSSVSTSTSTMSEYDSGLCSGLESSLSANTDPATPGDFAYEEARSIQCNYTQLVQHMCPSQIVYELFSENKISIALKDYLKTLPDPQKSEAILDHVMRADWETFGIFLQALDDTGQSHLSDMVRYVNTPTIYV